MTADRTAVFEAERARLTGLGYRMLGSQAEAEDVVQDAWIRWQRVDEPIDNPAAWLTTVTSRLALDRLRSARAQRESYPGPWLPEPLSADPGPADHAELADSITFGFLTVLERLGPVERVVFLLAEVFDVPLADVAEVIGRSPDATRQIASRARKRMRDDRTRFAANDESAWQTTLAFLAAAQDGDLDGLVRLLSEDAVLVSDGGPDRHAARRPVVGPERIARFVANVTKRMAPDSVSEMAEVNGVPGLVVRRGFDGPVEFALAIECDEKSIHHLYVVINPEKLTHI